MENKKDILEYISRYCTSFMSDIEKSASNHHYAQHKFLRYKDRSQVAAEEYSRLASNDPAVLELLKDGYDEFIERASERIYNEHLQELNLNFCPKCKSIARTPAAKQCRYCNHDWH